MEQIVMQVRGMDCGACEQRIQKALARLEGVRTSVAHHRSGEVRVIVDPHRTSEQAIHACITEAGFEVLA